MSDKNCFFFPSSSLKNGFVTKAMKRFFASNKKKIFQFFYQSFQYVFGIKLILYLRSIENTADF